MSGIVGSRLNIRGSGLVGGLGSDGQVLTSAGAGQEIVFEAASTGAVTALNSATANELTTVGSTTTELDAEANLTFTGSALTCIGTVTVGVDNTGHDVKYFGATSGKYWLWDESADGVVQIGTHTVGVDDAGHDVKFFGATSGKYWLWDESADGVVQIGTLTVGVDDAGHDVKFFGATASSYMLWDESENSLLLNASTIDLNGTADGLILDTDGDTTISSPTDDQIDVEIAGADDFTFTANTFKALAGSHIVDVDGGGSVRNRPNSNPIITNGNCAIAQRSASATGKTAGGYYAVDRMYMQLSSLGTWTIAQESLTSGAAFGDGFANAFRVDCTTAEDSPASGSYFYFQYTMEGQDTMMFKKGHANAEAFTLAFWVKSNKTGTAQVNLVDDNSRMCSGTYAISSADTWEHKIINYATETSNVVDDDNTAGFRLEFWLDAGSNFTSGAVPTAWESRATADRSVNDLALGDNTANDWAITGIQFEVGTYDSTTLPPFQHESYGDNLARCQRYYWEVGGVTNSYIGTGQAPDQDDIHLFHHNPVPMRAAPSTTYVSSFAPTHAGNFYFLYDYAVGSAYASAISAIAYPSIYTTGTKFTTGSDVWGIGDAVNIICADADSKILISADL